MVAVSLSPYLDGRLRSIYAEISQLREAAPTAIPEHEQWSWLKWQIYGRYFSGADSSTSPKFSSLRNAGFLASLCSANASREGWDFGWRALVFSEAVAIVNQHSVRLRVGIDDVRTSTEPGDLDGLSCALRVGPILFNSLPGYVLIIGDTVWNNFRRDDILIRSYLLVRSPGIIWAVNALTHTLNERGIPFRLKVVKQLENQHRLDSLVLFLPFSTWNAACPILTTLLREQDIRQCDGPLLTKKIGPAIYAAEDPGNGRSFGEHRAGLIARAFIEHNASDYDKWRHSLSEIFLSEGIELSRPYQNRRSGKLFAED